MKALFARDIFTRTQYCDITIKRYFDFSQEISVEKPRYALNEPQIKVIHVLLKAYLGL